MTDEEREMHLGFMREALAMAEYALTHSETPVGCIFVHHPSPSNTPAPKPYIIGRGYNHTNQTFNGTRHAEFIAINQILTSFPPSSTSPPSTTLPSSSSPSSPNSSTNPDSSRKLYGPEVLRECDLYVTVEPCIMCASLLRQLGIRRVFYGASNEKFGGTGGVLNIQTANGRYDSFPGLLEAGNDREGKEGEDEEGWKEGDYEVSGGWLREEAIVLLRRFYVQENGRAPEEKRGKEGRVLRLDVEPLGVLGSGEGMGG